MTRSTIVERILPRGELARHHVVGRSELAAEPVFEEPPVLERPLRRPPMAVLCALDDGRIDDGETWRIREDRHVIGRSAGQTRIPHDQEISARHAAIVRQNLGNGYRWLLRDLRSTNGTFLRVERSVLRQESELWIGSRRYRFLLGGPFGAAEGHPEESLRQTRPFARHSVAGGLPLKPRLVEVRGEATGREGTIVGEEFWIGSSPRCTMVIDDDPFVSRRHACIRHDARGRWIIETANALNGIWIRIQRTVLDCESEFRLGEQRFRICFP